MSDDENDSVHTPTQSEFATFEILANRDYTNMSKKKPRRKDLRGSFPVDVVEEEDDEQPSADLENTGEEDEDLRAEPREEEEHDDHLNEDAASAHSGHSAKSNNNEKESEKDRESNDSRSDSHGQGSPPATPPKPKEPSRSNTTSNSKPKKAYFESVENERRDEKEGLLTELLSLAESGQCKLVRTLTMKDSLEEISFQYDRCQSEIEARRMVNLAKSSIDVGAGLIEMVAKNFGFPLLDGYHKSLCSDMNRFDRPLTKIYKKYWRRGAQKPEMELAMIIIGSFGWTVMSNMMKDGSYLKKFFGGKGKAKEDEAKAKEKEKEMEALKAKFSSSSSSSSSSPPATPPSPTNSNSGKKMMRPPSASMNLTSPWTQVSSSPKIEVIDERAEKQAQEKADETASALQSLKLKEIEMERRMERLSKMEEDMSKRLALSAAQKQKPKVSNSRKHKKSLEELAQDEVDEDEDDEEEEEDEDEDEDDQEDDEEKEHQDKERQKEKEPEPRRVVVISSPPASGRRSGRKGGPKQPVVRL